MKNFILSAVSVLFLLSLPNVRAETAAPLVVSGPGHVALLELFTSEGCSSCPPAEAWMSRFAAAGESQSENILWRDVVPVVFHVDYWDNLGWPDALASPAHTARQRAYAAAWGSGSVYTPGFVLDGREWPGFQNRENLPPPRARAVGRLEIFEADSKNRYTVRFAPVSTLGSLKNLSAQLFLLGSGIRTEIRRGENAGRALIHDFAVLSEVQGPMNKSAGAWSANFTLPSPTLSAPRLALAATVAQPGETAPLQAVGGWIPSGALGK